MRPRETHREGFTLVEVMVALGLFGLIAVAGFTLLKGVIGTRDRLDGRLERLAELQRAMFLITEDFEAMSPAPIFIADGAIEFTRQSAAGQAATPVRYALVDKTLTRRIGAGAPVDQALISDVSVVEWSFLIQGTGWRADWPSNPEAATDRPAAIALTVVLTDEGGGLTGPLRRVVELPAKP